MKAETLIRSVGELGIQTLIGVPDSTLKAFCDCIYEGKHPFEHCTVPNEGTAVGLSVGVYLATGKPACIYMQNSGAGNALNPVTSLANAEIYGIPMLFIVGYRGEPGTKDESQHKFMGRITEKLFDCLMIEHAVIDATTTESELKALFGRIAESLEKREQFCLIVRKNTFDERKPQNYQNSCEIVREDAIAEIIKKMRGDDLIVSTTGKISREVYEQADRILGEHDRCFLTVGGMGHASMIAAGIAKNRPDKRVVCLDGDGAVLMHMGSLAFIAKQNIDNLIHICLNNDAHESVGGMPTSAMGFHYAEVAEKCGYPRIIKVESVAGLKDMTDRLPNLSGLTFIEIKTTNSSREDIGRPKESARENADKFMQLMR